MSNSLRNQLNTSYRTKSEALSEYIKGRRKIKTIARFLRNQPISTVYINSSTWSDRYSHIAYIYMSKQVSSMKDCAALLARIDDLPGVTEHDGYPNGWTTEDSPSEGTRVFRRSIIFNRVNVIVQLTAIPSETLGVDGQPKCRRVVVGQKESIERRTDPVYEIICED